VAAHRSAASTTSPVTTPSETFKDLGLLYGTSIAAEALLEFKLLTGDPVEVEREARALYEEYRWMSAKADAALALALCGQERYEEAARYADRSGERLGDLMDKIIWRIASAQAFAGLGQLDQALRVAHEAVTLADTTDALNLQGDALMGLAEVFRGAGRPEEAAEAARRAHNRYRGKGNIVSSRKAETLLSRLSRTAGP
jgi:tetratricopeptide (TPR) repeat protein